jgi:four helix bundle protein
MSSLRHANSFRDLVVYQKSRELQQEIFQLTAKFPKAEVYSLTDQIRRSSRAIGANIAEAWAKRRYEKHFISKLTDADGEQMETQHWIEIAMDCDYWAEETAMNLTRRCEEVGRLLNGMMAKADLFCGRPGTNLREPSLEYLIHDHSPTDH